MDSISSPSLPFTSDPALCDDWEEQLNLLILPSSTNSDDFEALHLVQEESTARKNKEGVVIQHRAWPLGEAFRSETDFPAGIIVLIQDEGGMIAKFIFRNTTSIATEAPHPAIFTTESQNALRVFSNRIPCELLPSSYQTIITFEILGTSKTKGCEWIPVG
jgi:hypothetical protein